MNRRDRAIRGITFLDDVITDAIDPEIIRSEEFYDELGVLTQALQDFWCREAGHTYERDQCNLPEHDYCIVCMRSTPFMVSR